LSIYSEDTREGHRRYVDPVGHPRGRRYFDYVIHGHSVTVPGLKLTRDGKPSAASVRKVERAGYPVSAYID
jgi:hypothetical protein